MEKIIAFFDKQPFTRFIKTERGYRLLTEWFPISDAAKIKVLKDLGYKVNIDQNQVRNEMVQNNSNILQG